MYIQNVKIENIRRFGSGASGLDLTLPKSGWIVVAGPNGSGKTTLLRILALGLAKSFSHEYADSLFTWLRRGEKQAHSRLTLVRQSGDTFHTDGGPNIQAKTLQIGDDWQQTGVRGAMSHGRESQKQQAFAGPWHDTPDGWFAAGYGTYRTIASGASLPEGWSSEKTRESAFLTLFRENIPLNQPVRWLIDLAHQGIDQELSPEERKQSSELHDHVIALLNSGLLGSVRVISAYSKGLWVMEGDAKYDIMETGSGTQALVALVADIVRHIHARFGKLRVGYDKEDGLIRIKNNGVVLIDEAEQHLHPSWQRQVGFWFRKHFPNIQFIVTTHSPFICQAANRNGLVLLTGGASAQAKIADERLYRKVVNGSVDSALLSELFGLGRTWSEEAEKRRRRLATLEGKVLTDKASTEEIEEYKTLREEIPHTMSDEVEQIAAKFFQARGMQP